MKGHQVRSGVNWQGTLKQKGVKQSLGVHVKVSCFGPYNFI
jgi:hypothetical protein